MKLTVMSVVILFLSTSFIEGKSDIGFIALNIKQENLNGDTITLKITLTNNSPDTLKYESMTCSWQDYYRTASKNWAVLKKECFINGHNVEMILPYQSQIKILNIKKVKSFQATTYLNFRIGFNCTSANNSATFESARKDINKAKESKIIWSNPIIISP